jgi:DNA polymerase-3 subunit gamma/tau
VLRKKVYVIDEVHMLTTEAFNALLKTLEEPPPHVTFVLATTEPHKLPNTILSRCQRYDFKLVPASRLAQHLTRIFEQEKLPIESGAVGLLVRESGGSVRDALSLCDQIISYVGAETITERHVAEVLGVADRSLTRSLVRALAGGDAGAALAAVESALERGVDEIQLARAIVRYLRDLSVLQVAPSRIELVDATDEERADLLAETRELDRSRVTQMFERMLRCCDELGKTLQPRLVLDCALIDVATVEPLVPLGDLIERLGELEARLAGKGGGVVRGPAPAMRSAAPAPAPARPAPPATSGAPRASGAPASAAPRPSGPPAASAGPASVAAPNGAPSGAASGAPPPRAPAATSAAPAPAPSAAPAPSTPLPAPSTPLPAPSTPPPAPSAGPGQVSVHASVAPSGPIPQPPPVASGSGPHGDRPLAAPTMGVPTTPEDAMGAWHAVLSQLEAQRKVSLFGLFEHARILRWTKDALELGYPAGMHDIGEMAGEREKLDELRVLIRDLVPEMKSVKISVRMLDAAESQQAGARSIIETSRERGQAERSKRESEAREHPITKHVLQTFGAQIKEIKTDV